VVEITHRVTPVAVARRAIKYRHDVQHVYTQFLQVRQFCAQAFQVICEAVAIQRHADPFLAQEPVVVLFPRQIQFPQIRGALDIAQCKCFDQADHLLLEVGTVTVQQMEQGMNGVKIRTQTGEEMPQAEIPDLRFQFDQYFIQQRV
jgi:hypothetical protein